MNTKKSTTDRETAEITYNAVANDYAHQEQFLMDYNNCCLCGDELIFSHVTNFIRQEVKEEAHCPSCKIRTKEHNHSLQ